MPELRDCFSRRNLLQSGLLAAATVALGRSAIAFGEPVKPPAGQPPIDRERLIRRHNVKRSAIMGHSPLQVGNGNIAFGADITGLQTFVPFNILSQWGWHSTPVPPGVKLTDMADINWPNKRRGTVPYDTGDPNHVVATTWLFYNPIRMNLGRIGLRMSKSDGGMVSSENELTDKTQELDLWTGTLKSQFKLDGEPATVTTTAHPDLDAIAVRIESPLISQGRIAAYVDFPQPDTRGFSDYVGSSDHAGAVPTKIVSDSPARTDSARTDLVRQIGDDIYHISIVRDPGTILTLPAEPKVGTLSITRARYGSGTTWLDVTAAVSKLVEQHAKVVANNAMAGSDPVHGKVKQLEITYTHDKVESTELVAEDDTWIPGMVGGRNCFNLASKADSIEFLVAFSPKPLNGGLPTASQTIEIATKHWPEYWKAGGAIDLSGSTDPRAAEFERRIVLSQYLMAVNEAGDLPPQESGLVNNGWSGKFHMEMYWWHAAHWALWNRWPALDRSSGVYGKMLDDARARAHRQGYKGARWTKMTGPDFHNAPNDINPLLVWQQPHPMFFAEMEYRAKPTRETLEKWKTVLFEAADFMASYPDLNPETKYYDLGPPIYVASEINKPRETKNPAFELCYWRFGLRIAQTWRERLGMPRDTEWDTVLKSLAPLPVEDGVYITYEGCPHMWTGTTTLDNGSQFTYHDGHPTTTGVFGWLPGDGVDLAVMRATFDKMMAAWNMDSCWGWDFPMWAMTAARLGETDTAIELMLKDMSAFSFDDAGYALGGPFPYFPTNGAFLYTVALMVAGWDGAPADKPVPGFPDNGKWVVKFEGLSRAI